jgi:hypothetical protein
MMSLHKIFGVGYSFRRNFTTKEYKINKNKTNSILNRISVKMKNKWHKFSHKCKRKVKMFRINCKDNKIKYLNFNKNYIPKNKNKNKAQN